MITVGEAVSKAKSYLVNQTGAPSHSLVLEAIDTHSVSYVIKFIEVAALGQKTYGYYLVEVDNESGIIKGLEKSDPNDVPSAIEPPTPQNKLPDPQFELVKDTDDTFRFLLRISTGEVIVVSRAYESKAECLDGIKIVKENVDKAGIHDLN